jgi:alpha-beta hydrolase superfamily lysophospholipase
MNHFEDHFTGYRGYTLYCQEWIPDTPIKGSVQIVHGFAEHSGRYRHVVDKLVPAGFAVYADDHFGHGKSDGQRGFIKKFTDYIEDEHLLLDHFNKRHPDSKKKPRFLLGHSMGTLIALYYVVKYPDNFTGLILSGFGTRNGSKVSGFIKVLSNILSFIIPSLTIDPKLDHPNLTRDMDELDAYYNDPLVFISTITFRLGAEIMKTQDTVKTVVPEVTLPVLVQVGSEDTIMIGHEEFDSIFTMKDKTIKEYPGLKHEVYNELKEDRNMVLNDLLSWLKSHY